MRLIDKDELYSRLGADKSTKSVPCYVAEAIEKCEVVEPVKHGHWTAYRPLGNGLTDYFECSLCGETAWTVYFAKECDYEYCPNCGAKMEVE